MCLKSTVERRKYECIFKPLYFVKPFNKLKSQLIHKISWLTISHSMCRVAIYEENVLLLYLRFYLHQFTVKFFIRDNGDIAYFGFIIPHRTGRIIQDFSDRITFRYT